MIRWFYEGEIHQSEAVSAEMESWIVKSQKGSELPMAVEAKLKELGWNTEREIEMTDVLGRRYDESFGDLRRFGDVDVLAFRDDSTRVLIIECKDLQFRKTP